MPWSKDNFVLLEKRLGGKKKKYLGEKLLNN